MLIRTKLSALNNRFGDITMNGKVHDLEKELDGPSHDRPDTVTLTGQNASLPASEVEPIINPRPGEKEGSFNLPYVEKAPILSKDFDATTTVTSPSLRIDNCCGVGDDDDSSRPTTLVPRKKFHHYDTVTIKELSESPQRFSHHSSLSVSPPSHDSDEDHVSFQPPNSPLLVAMRTAVDSLNQYEDFQIVEEIGTGFYADVFKVIHKPTGQLMVLKKSKRKAVSMLKEVELLKKLQHPNILHYVGACIHEGQLHPLTEFVNGGTLEHLIQGKKEFSWKTRLNLSLDVCKGIEYLHTHGMLHRDLNSKNVLLRKHSSKYTGVVADFGLAAKRVPPLRKLQRSQSIVGTPYWMAPEVLKGKPYNETADVFSYGIVLCEIISRLSADPDDIPRNRDFSLDVDEYQRLPEVIGCPKEFMELAFLSCRILPAERPLFAEIKTRLHIIRDLHNLHTSSSLESLESDTDTIEPKPSIRLSWHKRFSRSPTPPSLEGSPTQSQPSSPAILHPASLPSPGGNQTQFTLETSV